MNKVLSVFLFLCVSCGTYQYVPNTTYVDIDTTPQDITSVFTNYNTDIIRIHFKPFNPRFYFSNHYGYWGIRPLWLDFDFYNGHYYNYYSSFYRPWNYWNYYIRPNWTQGPFNNQGYNVVYNSSRRTMKVKDKIALSKLSRSRLVITKKPNINYKPIIKPRINYNTVKPSFNNKPNFNSRPNLNSKPRFNSKPATFLKSKGGN